MLPAVMKTALCHSRGRVAAASLSLARALHSCTTRTIRPSPPGTSGTPSRNSADARLLGDARLAACRLGMAARQLDVRQPTSSQQLGCRTQACSCSKWVFVSLLAWHGAEPLQVTSLISHPQTPLGLYVPRSPHGIALLSVATVLSLRMSVAVYKKRSVRRLSRLLTHS